MSDFRSCPTYDHFTLDDAHPFLTIKGHNSEILGGDTALHNAFSVLNTHFGTYFFYSSVITHSSLFVMFWFHPYLVTVHSKINAIREPV
jgi:hypothetical protein